MPTSSTAPERRAIALPIATFVLAAVVAAVYARSLGIGLLSDAYYILHHVQHGFLQALRWDHSYHYVPVTNEFLALLWQLFGLWDPGYQLASLLQLVLNGVLLFVLARRWLGDSWPALLSALLFVVNSSFYEVTSWAVNGNLHNLSATWMLLAILGLDRSLGAGKLVAGGWVFAGWLAVGFLTYELTISLTVIGAWIAWLHLAESDQEPPLTWLWRRSSWRRLAVLLAPTVLVGLGAVASKVYFQTLGMQVTNTEGSYPFRLYLLVRSVIATFTLTAPDSILFRRLTFGLPISWGTREMYLCVGVWALVLAAATVWVLWRARSVTVRLLVLWMVSHLGLSHLFTGLTSRHFFLAALPASMLLALGIRHAVRWLSTRMPRRWAVGVVSVLVLYLAMMSVKYVQRAITLHLDATVASRSVLSAMQTALEQRPSARSVTMLDMRASLQRRGLGAYVFINGLHHQVDFYFGDRIEKVELRYTHAAPPRNELANNNDPIGGKVLRARLDDPSWIVLRLDPETWRVRPVTEEDLAELLRKR